MKKTTIILIIIIILLILGGVFFFMSSDTGYDVEESDTAQLVERQQQEEQETAMVDKTKTVIGQSVEGRNITAYHFGDGEKEVLFVGGIHGGYEWNTASVAYEAVDYFKQNTTAIPQGVKVTIIPVLNPDGLYEVVGTANDFSITKVPKDPEDTISGRFNANGVDLNRNFDCDWQSTGTWQDKSVDGGDSVFSEPESKAIRNYINSNNPEAVVIWYSKANGVFASSCHNGVLPKTLELTNVYADASGYPAYEEYNFYEITGDMANWLAKEKIPAISVLLATHDQVEWDKNKKGIEAILEYYSQ